MTDRAERPTKDNPNVRYGEWERADKEIAPVLAPSYGLRGRFLGVRLYHAHRRRRYETWIENGQKWGRWEWEYAETTV